jgi:hypothetical protein
MKSEVHDEQEEESPPPPPTQHPHSISDNLIDEVAEHSNNHDLDNELNFDSMKTNESQNSLDRHVEEEGAVTEDTVPISSSQKSDRQPSNHTTDCTVPFYDAEGSDRTTTAGSYRGFMYRNRRGTTGDSGTPDEIQLARVNVHHNHGLKIFRLIRYDWFHVILRYPKGLCLLCLISIWTFVVIIFAFIYVGVDGRVPTVDCGLGTVGSPIRFGQAFAFSLETATTGTAIFCAFNHCLMFYVPLILLTTFSLNISYI